MENYCPKCDDFASKCPCPKFVMPDFQEMEKQERIKKIQKQFKRNKSKKVRLR